MIKDEATFKWRGGINNNDLIASEMHCVEKLYFRILGLTFLLTDCKTSKLQ